MPQREFHKGAFRVVGSQDAGDERKEIQQPALLQRLPDRVPTIALAEDLIHDVRMSDVFAVLGRMRILGNHPVRRQITASRRRPLQANLKRT